MFGKRVLAVLAGLFLLSCAHAPAKKAPVAALRVTIFDCGTIDVADISVFSPGFDKKKKKTLTDSCYLIEHPKGRLLWDTGLIDTLASKPEGEKVMEVFTMTLKQPLSAQMSAIGVRPSDIDYLGLSHFHFDHIGNATRFKNAEVLVQSEEYDTAFAADAEKKGIPATFTAWLKAAKVRKLTGDLDVFGDGSVVIKRTIGHTPGHQSLFVRLPKTGPVFITGDLVHFTKNRVNKRVPSFNWDKKKSLAAMKASEAFVKKEKAQVWIQHDLEQNQKLAHAPAFFE